MHIRNVLFWHFIFLNFDWDTKSERKPLRNSVKVWLYFTITEKKNAMLRAEGRLLGLTLSNLATLADHFHDGWSFTQSEQDTAQEVKLALAFWWQNWLQVYRGGNLKRLVKDESVTASVWRQANEGWLRQYWLSITEAFLSLDTSLPFLSYHLHYLPTYPCSPKCPLKHFGVISSENRKRCWAERKPDC